MRAKNKQRLAREFYAKTICSASSSDLVVFIDGSPGPFGTRLGSGAAAILVDHWSFSKSKCTVSKAMNRPGGNSGLTKVWGFELGRNGWKITTTICFPATIPLLICTYSVVRRT